MWAELPQEKALLRVLTQTGDKVQTLHFYPTLRRATSAQTKSRGLNQSFKKTIDGALADCNCNESVI